MYELCMYVNFMFQFEVKFDYPFTFQIFFSKYPVLGYLPKPRVNTWVNTQKIFTYPLGVYPPHITIHDISFNVIVIKILSYNDPLKNIFLVFFYDTLMI